MAVLVVVGLTNLAWMAGIALIFLAEKHWRHAVALSRVVGTALIALGVAILVEPTLLGRIAG
jgi:predicted metal-binding membrane protein